MDIAQYVLESLAQEIVSILINGHHLTVPEAYEALSESGILIELEENPHKLISTTFNDCLEYAEDIVNVRKIKELREMEHVKELELF